MMQNAMQYMSDASSSMIQRMSTGAGSPTYTRLPQEEDIEDHGDVNLHEDVDSDAEKVKWNSYVRDLDLFFTRVYDYHSGGGFQSIMVERVLDLMMRGFVIVVIVVMLLFVDWPRMMDCRYSDGCDDIKKFGLWHNPLKAGTFRVFVALYFVLGFVSYWVWLLKHSVDKIMEMQEMKEFFEIKLLIDESTVRRMRWPQIVDAVQKQAWIWQKNNNVHDVLDITNRIMRRKNYMIALINDHSLLPLKIDPIIVPSPIPKQCLPAAIRDRFPDQIRLPVPEHAMCKTMETALELIITRRLFGRDFKLAPEFSHKDEAKNGADLERQLNFAAFLIFMLSPFICAFMVMYIVLMDAEKFYKTPSLATKRRWSQLARWKYREFNELDHVFQQRMRTSYEHADKYVAATPRSDLVTMIARFITFVLCSFVALCLGICFINDSLMSTSVYGRNLWWYLALSGSVISVSRAASDEPTVRNNMDSAVSLLDLYATTHYDFGLSASDLEILRRGCDSDASEQERIASWKVATSPQAIAAVKEVYNYRAVNAFQEFFGIIIAPIMLITRLAPMAPIIVKFIHENTETSNTKIGDVYGPATFDFDKYGDPKYGARLEPSQWTIWSRKYAKNGKMEKSYVNFVHRHRGWNHPKPTPTMEHIITHSQHSSLTRHQRRSADIEAQPALGRITTGTLVEGARNSSSDGGGGDFRGSRVLSGGGKHSEDLAHEQTSGMNSVGGGVGSVSDSILMFEQADQDMRMREEMNDMSNSILSLARGSISRYGSPPEPASSEHTLPPTLEPTLELHATYGAPFLHSPDLDEDDNHIELGLVADLSSVAHRDAV